MINIYLDVDETINAFSWSLDHDPSATTGYRGYKSFKAGWCHVLVSEELVDELNELARLPYVNIVWTTDWFEDSAEVFAPAVGLDGPWEHLDGDDQDHAGAHWWKLRAVQEHVAETSPELAIWVDDCLREEPEVMSWVESNELVRAIHPPKGCGLTKAQVQLIRQMVGQAAASHPGGLDSHLGLAGIQ